MSKLKKLFLLALTVTALSVSAGSLGTENGRFVFGQINDMRADQFLLDTETGQIWRVTISEKGGVVMSAVVFKDIYGKKTELPTIGGVK